MHERKDAIMSAIRRGYTWVAGDRLTNAVLSRMWKPLPKSTDLIAMLETNTSSQCPTASIRIDNAFRPL